VGGYCALTEAAVRAFQEARGLRADGICDETTWTALVEANWTLGDRLLFLTSPNLRGDDVAALQHGLSRLGFDCGRVDGILGPRTARALQDFQRNCGLPDDAVCGPDTVRAIAIVSSQSGDGPGVQAVREKERLREGLGSLADTRIVIGQFSALSGLARTLARELRQRGATVMPLDEPDPVAQALAANHFNAHAYVGFETSADTTAVATFYRVPTFESVGGRALAEGIVTQLDGIAGLTFSACGMRLPVLRETRMPAVLLTMGPVRTIVDATPGIAAGVLHALELWISRAS
jgi:N-acetylmuramoyl-L-alanine amidase